MGIGQGVKVVFLGDNIPTVTHKRAPYVKNLPGYSTSNTALAQRSVWGNQQRGTDVRTGQCVRLHACSSHLL